MPAASVAVLRGDEVHAAASGILNLATGVEATADSLFQIGSITKVWTATLVMHSSTRGGSSSTRPCVAICRASGWPTKRFRTR